MSAKDSASRRQVVVRPSSLLFCVLFVMVAGDSSAADSAAAPLKIYVNTDLEAAIPRCRPYRLTLPIQGKREYLVFRKDGSEPKLVTQEATFPDTLHILDFPAGAK